MAAPTLAFDLRRARESEGLTIEEVAGFVGVTERSIIAAERGERMPRLPNAYRLAAVYGRRVSEVWPEWWCVT